MSIVSFIYIQLLNLEFFYGTMLALLKVEGAR